MEEKREAYWGSAGDDFIPYMTIFFYLGGDSEAAEGAVKRPLRVCTAPQQSMQLNRH
jgi:hypothetical protein